MGRRDPRRSCSALWRSTSLRRPRNESWNSASRRRKVRTLNPRRLATAASLAPSLNKDWDKASRADHSVSLGLRVGRVPLAASRI